MSRHYATDDRGRRFLHYIECDGCPATLKPGPHVRESGWRKTGLFRPGIPGHYEQWDWCPECEDNLPALREREKADFIRQYGRHAWDRKQGGGT